VAQRGIDVETIVVDDNSTDRTAEIAWPFATNVDRNGPTGKGTTFSRAEHQVSLANGTIENRALPNLEALPETEVPHAESARNSTTHVAAYAPVRPTPDEGVRGYVGRVEADVRVRPSVTLIPAGSLPDGWTGKNNAMSAGTKIAKGKWLLFTDADTVHKPGSLARTVAEAEQHGVALLSYSPEQEVRGFWEKAVMPVIFAELAATYPPKKVNDPASPIAAANGQYLMISREAYDAVGGHTKIAGDLLEDVAMARLVKSSGRKIFFRYGGDAVRTRMYRSWSQMKEGWTKNLALLFPSPWFLAIRRWGEFVSVLTVFLLGIELELLRALGGTQLRGGSSGILLVAVIFLGLIWIRIRHAHFPVLSTLLAFIGLPLFAFLLIRSANARRRGVMWKDRRYASLTAEEQGLFPRVLNAVLGTVQSVAVMLMTVIFAFVFYLVVSSSRELLLAQRH
jgi:glycosyltransferase involved in cell wall biosynthesis